MAWNIPSENAIITRLDELYEALDRFPDSPMAPAWQHEDVHKRQLMGNTKTKTERSRYHASHQEHF